MKKSEEDTKKKGIRYLYTNYLEWEIINVKISELQLPQKEAEDIKNEIKKKEAEFLRNK